MICVIFLGRKTPRGEGESTGVNKGEELFCHAGIFPIGNKGYLTYYCPGTGK